MNFGDQPISINELSQILDGQELSWFLNNLSKKLHTDCAELQSVLEQKQWGQAKHIAHQLKSMSYLSEDEMLIKYLDDIDQQDLQLIPTENFRKQLSQAFDKFQNKIQQHISTLLP